MVLSAQRSDKHAGCVGSPVCGLQWRLCRCFDSLHAMRPNHWQFLAMHLSLGKVSLSICKCALQKVFRRKAPVTHMPSQLQQQQPRKYACCYCRCVTLCSTTCMKMLPAAAVMASYERNFPLKDLAPVFAEIEAARKETEEARAAAKKGKGKKHAAADEPPGEPGALTWRMPGHPWTLAPHMAIKQILKPRRGRPRQF